MPIVLRVSELAGTGRHLSTVELRAWTSFLDASRIIDTELENHLTTEHDMSHREYEVLVRLDGHGGRMRLSVLARQIEASAPLITQTIDRLERRSWVSREQAIDDKRGVDAVLAPQGRDALAAAAGAHAELIRTLLLERLGPNLDPVAATLGTVADHLRSHRLGQDCNDDCPLNQIKSTH